MVAARSSVRGLSTQDVDSIRSSLAAGRRPKVVFTASAGQIAGQLGQVVELTDPDGSEDFIVVRFGRDELPFSPTDLTIAPKGAGTRRPAKAVVPDPDEEPGPGPDPGSDPGPKLVSDPAVDPAGDPAPESPAAGSAPAGSAPAGSPESATSLPSPPSLPAPREEPTMSVSTVDSPVPADPPADPPAAGDEPVKPRKAAKQAKPKAPAGLEVLLSYVDGDWLVAANQGTKALAKPYIIKPADALKMVAMLDVPGVQEAVEQIVAAERTEVEQQAQRLRAELAEIEAKLADLPELE